MIILITGASHTGKTLLAQRMLEQYKYPYLSIDHLKMGLIRSGNTELTPLSDDMATIAELEPNAKILKGLPVEMSEAENGCKDKVKKWIQSLNIL